MIGAVIFASLLSVAFSGAPAGPETVYNDAGTIKVRDDAVSLFYWVFESRNNPSTDPLLLWLSGGPGCSSLLALFFENGPYIVNDDLSLSLNPYSWNENANVIWIDQPAGTGFSTGPYIHNEDQMADDLYEFLEGFFVRYPQYSKLPFYIFGESYAGHYVPRISSKVVEMIGSGSTINFQGFAIGNGLTNPLEQYKYYAPYALDHDLVSEQSYKMMEAILPICENMIDRCNTINGSTPDGRTMEWVACLNAYTFCSYGEMVPVEFTGVNMYDVREQCDPTLPLCYDFSTIEAYLNQDDVQKALGVTKTWRECNRLVDMSLVFAGDWMLRFDGHVSTVLNAGYRGLIYAGEFDFICNWYGNQAWTETLEWDGMTEFQRASNTSWVVNRQNVGSYKTADGFTFLRVANAGHMVPHDQPANSLDMINRFFKGEF